MKPHNSFLRIHFLVPAIILTGCTFMKPGEDQLSLYREQHRPQFHFSPDSMWMNDPNGLVYYDGEYHLFYQHNPEENTWGPMHWGHAVSHDLVYWEHLPIALYPDSLGTIFSGSAVIDRDNTTGLGNGKHPPMVAIFTHHNHDLEMAADGLPQYQSIAFSLDKGRTWEKYSGNPVLENPGIRDFRDPKVIWYSPENKWIMVLAAKDRVIFYSSPDLLSWTMESEFGMDLGAHGGVWECPDLFPLTLDSIEKWALLVSLNSRGPNGGSGTQYFIGNFDGRTFICDNPSTKPLWLDWGKDNYAGVTWSDIPPEDGRRLFMGWMSNWEYAQEVPTERWRSAMTIPRELSLERMEDQYILCSNPISELQKLRKSHMAIKGKVISGLEELKDLPGEFTQGMYEIDLRFSRANGPQNGNASVFGLMLMNGAGQQITVGVNLIDHIVFIDRTNSGKSGFSDSFSGIHTARLPIMGKEELRLRAFIDLSSIELFADNGHTVMTEIFFPDQAYNRVVLFADNGSVQLKEGSLHSLKSIWQE
jgi:fructan beta-fructosidase